jgi:hypothetical protein
VFLTKRSQRIVVGMLVGRQISKSHVVVGGLLDLAGTRDSDTGFALGFYFGYEDAPDCESVGFSDQLKQVNLWKQVGLNLSGANELRFVRDPNSPVIATIVTRAGNPLSLRDSYLAVNSVVQAGTPLVTPATFIVSEDVRDKLASNTASRDPLKYLPF